VIDGVEIAVQCSRAGRRAGRLVQALEAGLDVGVRRSSRPAAPGRGRRRARLDGARVGIAPAIVLMTISAKQARPIIIVLKLRRGSSRSRRALPARASGSSPTQARPSRYPPSARRPPRLHQRAVDVEDTQRRVRRPHLSASVTTCVGSCLWSPGTGAHARWPTMEARRRGYKDSTIPPRVSSAAKKPPAPASKSPSHHATKRPPRIQPCTSKPGGPGVARQRS
jgi:hypothetical protein